MIFFLVCSAPTSSPNCVLYTFLSRHNLFVTFSKKPWYHLPLDESLLYSHCHNPPPCVIFVYLPVCPIASEPLKIHDQALSFSLHSAAIPVRVGHLLWNRVTIMEAVVGSGMGNTVNRKRKLHWASWREFMSDVIMLKIYIPWTLWFHIYVAN